MREVKVYTSEGCKFSAQVKELFGARKIPFEEIVLTKDSQEHTDLGERTGSMKLPQVFVGAVALGGAKETFAADSAGLLADMLVD